MHSLISNVCNSILCPGVFRTIESTPPFDLLSCSKTLPGFLKCVIWANKMPFD